MDTIGKENKLKKNSEQEFFLGGLSSKIDDILGNDTLKIDINNENDNDSNNILFYIVIILIILYLIYLFCN